MRSKYVETVAALAVLLAVTVGCFWPLFRHPRDVLVGPQRAGSNDLTGYFIPCHNYPRLCWDRFRQPPWWNPYSQCGVPYVGNPQSAVYYPPNWLCWWMDARHVLSWLLVAHHFFAGVGVYLLCSRYGLSWIGSAIGGVVFMAAPYLLAQTGEGHYAQLCVAAWMPWTILAYESVRDGCRGGGARLAAVLAMSFFAGHVQELYYVVLILSAWIVVDALAHWRAGRRGECWRLVRTWVLLGAGSVALVAVDLFPMLVYATQMHRASGLSATEAGAIGLGLPNLLQLINPFALGGPQSYGGRDKFFWETLCSFGLVPLALAVVGVVSGWRRYPVRRFAWSGSIAFAFAFGGGPVFRCLYVLIPGMSMFRAPSRVLFFCSLGIAILAAVGVDTILSGSACWSDEKRRLWRRALLALAGFCLVLMSVSKYTSSPVRQDDLKVGAATSDENEAADRQGGPPTHTSFLGNALRRTIGSRTPWAWLGGSLALIYVGLRWPMLSLPGTLGLLVLSATELSLYASKMLTTVPVQSLYWPGSLAHELRSESGLFRVLCPQGFLSDQLAWERGLAKVQGYEPLPLARYLTLFAALTGDRDPVSKLSGFSYLKVEKVQANVLDSMNVRFVLAHPTRSDRPEQLGWQLRVKEWYELYPGGMATTLSEPLFENPNALPRAFVVGSARTIGPAQDRADAMAELRPREEVLLERDPLPAAPRADFAAATIVEYTANGVAIEADLSAPGYLVLSDTWYPGWTAEDNGLAVAVRPANIAFRGVPLAAGKHRVIFRYRPPGLIPGAVISGVAWIVLFGSLAVRWGRSDGATSSAPRR